MRVTWSEPAVADLVAIHDYIARDSPHYAQRFVERLVAAVEPLESFPQLGRIVTEGDGRHRELLVASYRIIYRAEVAQVDSLEAVAGGCGRQKPRVGRYCGSTSGRDRGL
jgi:toxin ParE1/3/4